MKLTNKYNLPKAMLHALSHDRYDGGHGDVSCTTLIAPAQQFQLKKVHGDEVTEDASDLIWSLIGQAVHYVIENAVRDMKLKGEWSEKDRTEERFYHEVGGKVVSAQIDLLESGELMDFKITSVWSIKDAVKNGKSDWDAQLNIQRYLMVNNGIIVDHLYVIAIARDWNKSGNMRDNDYPPRVVKLKIPMWKMQKTEDYIAARINALFSEHVVPCTPDECWESPTQYALMKKGRTRAVRLLDSTDDLQAYATDKGLTTIFSSDRESVDNPLIKGHYIEIRPGERKRCQNYCDVAPFCSQWEDWQEEHHG